MLVLLLALLLVLFLYLVALLLALAALFVINRLLRMPIGRAWEALREDEIACRALGMNPTVIKLSAFTLGATFAGFAGSFFAGLLPARLRLSSSVRSITSADLRSSSPSLDSTSSILPALAVT